MILRLLLPLLLTTATAGLASAQTIQVSGDATVNSAYPNTNFGGTANLAVNATSSALVEFPLSQLPSVGSGIVQLNEPLFFYFTGVGDEFVNTRILVSFICQ